MPARRIARRRTSLVAFFLVGVCLIVGGHH